MLEAYAEWTAKARAFLVETGLVTLPDGRDAARSSRRRCSSGPILASRRTSRRRRSRTRWKGHFFVPFAPDGASEEEIQSRLSNNSLRRRSRRRRSTRRTRATTGTS